jgi:hypothetical protein
VSFSAFPRSFFRAGALPDRSAPSKPSVRQINVELSIERGILKLRQIRSIRADRRWLWGRLQDGACTKGKFF